MFEFGAVTDVVAIAVYLLAARAKHKFCLVAEAVPIAVTGEIADEKRRGQSHIESGTKGPEVADAHLKCVGAKNPLAVGRVGPEKQLPVSDPFRSGLTTQHDFARVEIHNGEKMPPLGKGWRHVDRIERMRAGDDFQAVRNAVAVRVRVVRVCATQKLLQVVQIIAIVVCKGVRRIRWIQAIRPLPVVRQIVQVSVFRTPDPDGNRNDSRMHISAPSDVHHGHGGNARCNRCHQPVG